MEEKQEKMQLPENAFRELHEGEQYEPLMRADRNYPEVNAWSVAWGILMAVVFSAAAAYLGLKVGQVFEAAIPIAIIAVGLSTAAHRKNALGENVIIQSIGASSGVIVAGAIFTLPALYILQAKYPDISVSFFQVFLASLLGGCLGILFLIPFRRYFVKDMHGKYPFPEATATTQVLVSGQQGGNQARPLIWAAAIGGLYDFIVSTFGWWHETLSTRMTTWGETLAQKAKLTFSINTGAAILGLGYIVGLKYAAIICAGSLFVWWFLIPLLGMTTVDSVMLSEMDPQYIFTNYARYIGIGAIAMAGVIGIVKSWGVIRGAVGLAGRELRGKGKAVASATLRTDRDLNMRFLAIAILAALVIVFVFFYLGVRKGFKQWLIIFIDQDNTAKTGFDMNTNQKILKALAECIAVIFNSVLLFPSFQTGSQHLLQRGFIIIFTVEIEIQHRILFPGIRVSFFQLFYFKTGKQLLFALPVCQKRRKEQVGTAGLQK